MIASRAEILTLLGITSSVSEDDLALLNMIHVKAERSVKTYLQNDIEYAQYVEYLPIGSRFEERDDFVDVQLSQTIVTLVPGSTQRRILQLKHTPVWVTSLEVREDFNAFGNQSTSPFPSSSILTRGVDYYLDVTEQISSVDMSRTGHLIRIGNWSTVPKTIKVTYYAGWSATHLEDIASDIKMAVIKTVAKAWNQAKALRNQRGPVIAESLGHTSVTYSEAAIRELLGSMSSLSSEVRLDLQPYRNYGRLGN